MARVATIGVYGFDGPGFVAALEEAGVTRCQWPSVSPHRRPFFLPTDGHVFSPLVATNLPTITG